MWQPVQRFFEVKVRNPSKKTQSCFTKFLECFFFFSSHPAFSSSTSSSPPPPGPSFPFKPPPPYPFLPPSTIAQWSKTRKSLPVWLKSGFFFFFFFFFVQKNFEFEKEKEKKIWKIKDKIMIFWIICPPSGEGVQEEEEEDGMKKSWLSPPRVFNFLSFLF